jgi:site-specific DNA-methyltransferase (adenine-specific)
MELSQDAMKSTIELGEFAGTIHEGDCITGMEGMPAGTVDLVFADPPFNIGYEYDVYDDAREDGEYLDWSRRWMEAVHRILKDDGTFWLAIGDEYAAELKLLAQRVGFHLRSWVIWYYTFGVNCKNKFSRSHAHLFYFVKDKERFTFRSDELVNRVPSARLMVYGDRRGNPTGRLPDDTWILRPQDLADCFTAGEDTWYLPRVAGTFKERKGFHGCQMPEQLLGRIIRICSNREDLVVDPFSGSATTLAVAKKLGRKYCGFDVSAEYVARGLERLEGVRVGDPLEGDPEPTMSAPVTVPARRTARTSKEPSPYEALLADAQAARREWSRSEFIRGIISAYEYVYDGYSLDRVVLDPELNERFRKECGRQGLPGDILCWNRTLFNLRKAGMLTHLPTTRRTEFRWEEFDLILHASEIAWRILLDRGYQSLDDIFSDPRAAAEFDRIAKPHAPGHAEFAYRWGALKLRKETKRARERARLLRDRALFMTRPVPIGARERPGLPASRGVYMIIDMRSGRAVYAGGTLNLEKFFESQFATEAENPWRERSSRLALTYFESEGDAPTLLSYKHLLVRKHRPLLNILP